MPNLPTFPSNCLLAATLALAACATSQRSQPVPGANAAAVVPVELLDIPVSRAPYEQVHVNWKQRLDQPYVYVERLGDYRRVGEAIGVLLRRADELGVAPAGPLFCLYYDDPGAVPVERLRARACLPVARAIAEGGGLRYDVLAGTTVAYAVVEGPTWDVPRAYPAVYAWLRDRGWSEDGPLREVYLNLGGIERREELLTEVQVAWTTGA